MVKPSINLSFDGHCEDAFRFYERCLGGTITMLLTWGESPMAGSAPPEWGGKILHATLKIGDVVLTGADVPAYVPPQGFAIHLGLTDLAEAERIYTALADGTVRVPLQETFWALRFGEVTDRFGIPWGINCAHPSAVAGVEADSGECRAGDRRRDDQAE
jgi:PhnB protein